MRPNSEDRLGASERLRRRRSVVFYFPTPFYPSRAGNHRRGEQIIQSLHELDLSVTLASANLGFGPAWTTEHLTEIKDLQLNDVVIYQPSRSDLQFMAVWSRYLTLRRRSTGIDQWLHAPPGLRRWFTRLTRHVSAEAAIVTYVRSGALRPTRVRSVIDLIDLETSNQSMWRWLSTQLPPSPVDPAAVPRALLRENSFCGSTFEADPQEFSIYDRFDHAMAITSIEAEVVRARAPRTRTWHLPYTTLPRDLDHTYDGAAVLAMSGNPFNVQAYAYLAARVLPRLGHEWTTPVRVFGDGCDAVLPVSGVTLCGFVPDVATEYARCRMALCPILGGTGQPIKVIEAMAHGVPVVALEHVAARSPLVHGVNGLIARDAEEFANQMLRLSKDDELCRRLGSAARNTVAIDFAPSRAVDVLGRILGVSR